jgi:hypothetical protein
MKTIFKVEVSIFTGLPPEYIESLFIQKVFFIAVCRINKCRRLGFHPKAKRRREAAVKLIFPPVLVRLPVCVILTF